MGPFPDNKRMKDLDALMDLYGLLKEARDAIEDVLNTKSRRLTSREKMLCKDTHSALDNARLRLEKGAFKS